ncbi:hypothetical protein KKG24_01905 [Patescibacteria group bacterium]|nr:hypothetical protein [Patescibacteria group bacterium]
MKRLKIIDRKELIDLYLEAEEVKKQKSIPPGYDLLEWDNPNNLDTWLEKYGYKHGVISGFKQWAYVKLNKGDLMNCAIVAGIDIFCRMSQRLGNLENTEEFNRWEPNKKPVPIWYESLSRGCFKEKFAVIMRPACESEIKQGAKYYVEDGSGRMICYLRSILSLNSKSEMTAYLAFDPDESSSFLNEKLNKKFAGGGRGKYTTLEQTLQTIDEEIRIIKLI